MLAEMLAEPLATGEPFGRAHGNSGMGPMDREQPTQRGLASARAECWSQLNLIALSPG
jgi:hypothetical protein